LILVVGESEAETLVQVIAAVVGRCSPRGRL
jgi:hypothetical protein